MGKYSFLLLLFVSFICLTEGKSHWEPTIDVQQEISKKWKSLGVQYCQMFPPLSPLPPNYAPLNTLISQFASSIAQLVASEGTPSVTVNLIYDQDILWTQGYGLKNLSDSSSVPNGDTAYFIGSNTKLFTTLLALIAQDKGLLSFTDEVASHVPAFNPINPFPSKRSINFNQLASHMAGLQRESPCDIFTGPGPNCNITNAEMWTRIQNITLVNPPGVIPQYSNLGFATLGHVVEEIVGTPWQDLIQQEIFDPLQMTSSGPMQDAKFFTEGAIGYTAGNKPANLMQFGWEAPAGSIYSTTNDLAKFISLLFRDDIPYMQQPDQILDSLTIREWRDPRYINIDSTGYGIPWEIINSPIIYTKGGSVFGYLSLVITIPQLRLGMVVLQSSDAFTTFSEIFGLWAQTFVQPFAQILADIAPPPVIPPYFKNYIGSYRIFNATVALNITQFSTTSPPTPVIQTIGPTGAVIGVLPLVYISENTFKINPQGIATDCGSQQSGASQYLYLIPSSPPTFSIPGMFPDEIAVKLS